MNQKEYKIKNLFFAHIKGTHLEKKGVTAKDLAKKLESHGFIEIVSEDRYIYTEKKKIDSKNKNEFWKCVDSCFPSSQSPETRRRHLLVLLVLFYSGFATVEPPGPLVSCPTIVQWA